MKDVTLTGDGDKKLDDIDVQLLEVFDGYEKGQIFTKVWKVLQKGGWKLAKLGILSDTSVYVRPPLELQKGILTTSDGLTKNVDYFDGKDALLRYVYMNGSEKAPGARAEYPSKEKFEEFLKHQKEQGKSSR